MSSSKDNFEEARFMKELIHLRDTQEAIQTLSAWCLKNKKFSYKIARCWVKCVKKGNKHLISTIVCPLNLNAYRQSLCPLFYGNY